MCLAKCFPHDLSRHSFSGEHICELSVSRLDAANCTAGGTALGTTVSGGSRTVAGSASGTVLEALGNESILSGGLDSAASISAGGVQTITKGGTANSATVLAGGDQVVSSGGVANDTTVSSGGR